MTKKDILRKLTSRKFWLSAGAFLASIGTGITGIATDNKTLIIIGAVCTILSSAIYNACESYIDANKK